MLDKVKLFGINLKLLIKNYFKKFGIGMIGVSLSYLCYEIMLERMGFSWRTTFVVSTIVVFNIGFLLDIFVKYQTREEI